MKLVGHPNSTSVEKQLKKVQFNSKKTQRLQTENDNNFTSEFCATLLMNKNIIPFLALVNICAINVTTSKILIFLLEIKINQKQTI